MLLFLLIHFIDFLGRWIPSVTKLRTSLCHHMQRIQLIHMTEWRYQIRENECLVHTLNIQPQVHTKRDAFKRHVVFQKPQYLLEGKMHI